jgi:hypothetical protein
MWAEAYEHDERVQARKSDAHAITRGMSMRMRRTGQGSDGFSPCVRVSTLRVFFLGVPDAAAAFWPNFSAKVREQPTVNTQP